MVLLLIALSLFLAWMLGSKDSYNLFGFAFSTRTIGLFGLSLIVGLFIIAGSVWMGDATSFTISNIGNIKSLPAALIVASAAGITVFVMNRLQYQNSYVQAIVGAIAGWCVFTKYSIGISILETVTIIWLIAPILAAIFSSLLYLFIRRLLKKLKIHLIILDTYLRLGLILAIAFASFAFGANNIGSISGFFINSVPDVQLNFDILKLTGRHLVYLIGAIALSVGVFTQLRKTFIDKNDDHFTNLPETGIVLIVSQALVLFLFSSTAFTSLFGLVSIGTIPAVPLSVSQLAMGSLLGIGLMKGGREIKYKTVFTNYASIFSSLLLASIISTILFYLAKNLFGVTELVNETFTTSSSILLKHYSIDEINGINIIWYLFAVICLIIIGIFTSYLYKQKKQWQNTVAKLNFERKEHNASIQALTEANLKAIILENTSLNNRLEFNQRELIYYALNIVEQREYLINIYSKLKEIQKTNDADEVNHKVGELIVNVKQKLASTDQVDAFYVKIEQLHQNFTKRLIDKYPDLSEKEQNLIKLLKLGFSSKEIAPLLNISPKSVEISRYRLRKKLKLDKEENLIKFINNI